jgi:hypothetical protein
MPAAPTAVSTSVGSLNLVVSFTEGGGSHDRPSTTARSEARSVGYSAAWERRPRVAELSAELARLSGLVAIVEHAAAYDGGILDKSLPWAPEPTLLDHIRTSAPEVEVFRLKYASPLEIGLVVGQAIIASVSALSALVYGVKRLYGLDLELKTHRADREAEFLAAQRVARAIQSASDEDLRFNDWPPAARQLIDEHARLTRFEGEDAVLDEDDATS